MTGLDGPAFYFLQSFFISQIFSLERESFDADGISYPNLRHSFAACSLARGAKLTAISGAMGQPTIIRYTYSAQVEDIVLSNTGIALPAGYNLEDVKLHEVVAAEKANDKCKAAVKAENKRAAAFARLGF